jgi:hypothetical protein
MEEMRNAYIIVEKPIDPGIRWGINLKMKIEYKWCEKGKVLSVEQLYEVGM